MNTNSGPARAASSVTQGMRYSILLLLMASGMAHTSTPLGPDELDAQLRAIQRGNLIEIGIILAIAAVGIGAFLWGVLRGPKR